MSLQSVVQSMQGTHSEVLEQVQARTVTVVGTLEAGVAQMLLVRALIMPTINRVASLATHANPLFHGACQALAGRINGNVFIDLAMPGVETMLDLILADSEIESLLGLEGNEFGSAASFKAAVLAAASTTQSEFPSVTLRDVIAVKDPALATQQESNPVTIKGISQVLKLTTQSAMPETVRLTAQISHDGAVWQSVQTSGLESISGAGLYVFRVLPGPVFIAGSQIRVVSPYSVGISIA